MFTYFIYLLHAYTCIAYVYFDFRIDYAAGCQGQTVASADLKKIDVFVDCSENFLTNMEQTGKREGGAGTVASPQYVYGNVS